MVASNANTPSGPGSSLPLSFSARLACAACSVALLASCGAFGSQQPPFAHPGANPADPNHATVMVFWPKTSCDAAGYYVIVDGQGRYLTTITAGSRVSIKLDPGSYELAAWNPLREKIASTPRTPLETAVMRATVLAGRSYYVRLAFGEWNLRGPVPAPTMRRTGFKLCANTSPALLAITPDVEDWSHVTGWVQHLPVFEPDQSAGQDWLDSDERDVARHLRTARERWEELRPKAQLAASLCPKDGVGGL